MKNRLYKGDNGFDEILSLMEYIEGQNNYEQNVIDLFVDGEHVFAETACENEYGSVYGNDDRQELPLHPVLDILGIV